MILGMDGQWRLPTTQEEEWLQDYENRQQDSQERVEILADLREEEAIQQAYQEFEEEEMARAIQEARQAEREAGLSDSSE